MKEHRPPSVEVEWIDAVDRKFSGPIEEAKIRGKLYRRFQSGYLLHQTEEVTLLAQIYDPPEGDEQQGTVDYITVIPTKWVVRIIYKPQRRKKDRQQVVQEVQEVAIKGVDNQ